MVQFGKKRSFTDYLYTKPVIVVLAAIFVLLCISVYERFKIEQEMSLRRAAAESEQVELLKRKEEIQAKVEYLEGERGIEEEVRKHFDVAKEGEQVVILLGEETEETVEINEPEVRKKWYQFWR